MRATTTKKQLGGEREQEEEEEKEEEEETEREKADDLMNNRLHGNWILRSCRPPRSISSVRSIRGNAG